MAPGINKSLHTTVTNPGLIPAGPYALIGIMTWMHPNMPFSRREVAEVLHIPLVLSLESNRRALQLSPSGSGAVEEEFSIIPIDVTLWYMTGRNVSTSTSFQ